MPKTAHSSMQWQPSGKTVEHFVHDAVPDWSTWIAFKIVLRLVVKIRQWSAGQPVPAGPVDVRTIVDANKDSVKDAVAGWYALSDELLSDPDDRFGIKDWQFFQLTPDGAQGSVKRLIFYLNGGSWCKPLSRFHVAYGSRLANDLDAKVVFVPYELAPNATAARNFPALVVVYHDICKRARQEGLEVIVAGDSAGGNISGALPLALLNFLPDVCGIKGRNEVVRMMPSKMLLIAPAMDARCIEDTRLIEAQRLDWWLYLPTVRKAIADWIGTPEARQAQTSHMKLSSAAQDALPDSIEHPLLSPCLDDTGFELLKEAGTRIVLCCGTNDIVYPGALDWVMKADKHGIDCLFITGLDGPHVYQLLVTLARSLQGPQTAHQKSIEYLLRDK